MTAKLRVFLCVLVAAAVTTLASAAMAVTCTVNGTVAVEPLDGFYCDTSAVSNCAGWYETNLDSARGASAKRMQYMRIEVWQGANFLGKTHTTSNGTYSIAVTLPGGSCTGQQVSVQHWMERIHESDLNASTKRYRFSIVAYELGKPDSQMLSVWKPTTTHSLTGASTSVTVTFAANPASLWSRVANMYYTANSAITQVAGWSTLLAGHFANTSGGNNGIFRVIYGPDFAGGGGSMNPWDWAVVLGYETYNRGMVLRHEIGHAVREALHNRVCQFMGCSTYNYNYAPGYGIESCEYGSAAFNEGLASFFGVRSVTSADTNVWDCTCADNANQDVCSELSNATLGGDGVILNCAGGGSFIPVGDRWVSGSAWCKRVRQSQGCSGCAQDGNGYCVASGIYGWRNVVQVNRFMWDLIDTSSDGGYDDTDLTISSLVTAMQGMPASYGTDGSCRESERSSVSQCNPTADGDPVTAGSGSRDAYNTRDIAELVGGDMSGETAVNCVNWATDN